LPFGAPKTSDALRNKDFGRKSQEAWENKWNEGFWKNNLSLVILRNQRRMGKLPKTLPRITHLKIMSGKDVDKG